MIIILAPFLLFIAITVLLVRSLVYSLRAIKKGDFELGQKVIRKSVMLACLYVVIVLLCSGMLIFLLETMLTFPGFSPQDPPNCSTTAVGHTAVSFSEAHIITSLFTILSAINLILLCINVRKGKRVKLTHQYSIYGSLVAIFLVSIFTVLPLIFHFLYIYCDS